MMTTLITARPLTAEGFRPFGQVLEAPGAEPLRIERAATLDNRRPGVAPNLAIIRSAAKVPPVEVGLLERHRYSTQAFMPMRVSRYLVMVCPALADGAPDLSRCEAFVAGPGQGLNYNADQWHAGMTALDAPGEFAMFIWQDDSADDCEFLTLDAPLTVTTPA